MRMPNYTYLRCAKCGCEQMYRNTDWPRLSLQPDVWKCWRPLPLNGLFCEGPMQPTLM